LIVAVLPMLISALSSVLGKSVSEFNALPRSERPAKLRAVLRSKWMFTNPPAAIAARALAATDAGVNAAVNALEKYGAGAVAAGTEAAHAAAEKHLTKNPRSGGRMARVRIAPSIPSYALDRLDVTRARRNGAHVSPDTLTTLNVGDRFVIRDEDSPDRDSLPYTVTYRKFDDVKAETITGGSVKLFADGATVAIQGKRGTRTVYSIRRVNGARKNGYSRRRNCGGDCACAPCQARSNPDPFAAVRRAIEKEVARFVENGGGFGQRKLMDAAYRVEKKHWTLTGETLPVEAVVAEINAARTRAEGLRSAYNKRALHAAEQAYRDEMRGRSSYMNPRARRNGMGTAKDTTMQIEQAERLIAQGDFAGAKKHIEAVYQAAHAAWPAKWAQAAILDVSLLRRACEKAGVAIDRVKSNPRHTAARRNHHIRVGGTFYTPGGRRGTVLAEARGGYYRVRWSDGTVGTVQDNEWAAYPTAGSRANPATQLPTKVGETVSLSGSGGTLHVTKTKRNEYHAAVSGTRSATWGPSGTRWGNAQEMQEDIANWLRMGALPFSGGNVHNPRSNGRKTFRVRFHSAVGQGSRLKQVVERWGGKVGGGGVATFYGADDAEHAMRQAEGWGIAGEVIK